MRGLVGKFALAMIVGGVGVGSQALAQVVQRDTKITGPRGRTVERDVRIQRGPGGIERDIKITRPGGTFERETVVRRPGGGPGYAPGFRPGPPRGPGYYGGPREVIVENFYAPPPPPPPPILPFFGLAGPVFNFGFGASSPPVVLPPPVYVEPVLPPTVVVQPPVRYAEPAPAPTVVYDPVADAIGRLGSYHAHSRRDGALTLGRFGDERGVTPLVERLEKDFDKETRVAAAWSLGEIGDPRASLALQKASLYDSRQDVRNAAAIAYRKLGRPRAAQEPAPESAPTPMPTGSNAPILSTPLSGSRPPVGEPALDPLPNVGSGTPPPPPMPDPLGDLPPAEFPR